MINWHFIRNLPAEDKHLSPAISCTKILEALDSTSNSSTPGGDHITWRHLKLVVKDKRALQALTELFNRVVDEGVWPHQLKSSISCIIPKPKKPVYDVPKAFRPIALLNTIGKLLTKVITKRLQFEAQEHSLFHEGQFGGISRHSTTDVGLVLMDLITENRDCGLHTTVLTLDITQFFPSMSHEVICALLTKLGFNSKIVRFLAAFLQDRSTTYTWDSITTSTHFQCSDGIPQGGLLSPVNSFLRFDFHVQYYTNKGFSTIRACNMLSSSCGRLGPKQRVICYNAYVVSVLTYGLPLWYVENSTGVLKNFRKMARVQNYTVRWITGSF